MKVQKASAVLVVLLALLVLKRQGKIHSVCNIAKYLNAKKLNERTIINTLEYLEANLVIVCPYPKGERQGKSYQYTLYPFNVPEEVLEAKPSDNTIRRWLVEAETEGVIHWKQGIPILNGHYLTESMTQPLIRIAKWVAETLEVNWGIKPKVEFTHEWVVQGIHEKPLDPFENENLLKLLHFYICLQFLFEYPEEALSQFADLLERKGA